MSEEKGYSYHVEESAFSENRVEKFLTAFAAILRHSNYRFILDLYAKTGVKCAGCAVTCQVYQATGDPKDVPCYRTQMLLDVYKRHYTSGGWLKSKYLGGGGELTEEKIDEMAELFYRCSACHRCREECAFGIDHGLMTRLGRYVLSEAGIIPKGLVLAVREQLDGATGNTSAIPVPALLDTLEFLEEDFEEIYGESIKFPVDQEDAEYIFFPAVSDYLLEADTLMGNAAALQKAGIKWTIGSGYFDGINYGLFYSDWVMERIIDKVVAEARRLRAKKILIGECGHASRTARQFIPAFNDGDPLPVVNIMEVTWDAIQSGKIKLDMDMSSDRVTYHDPCNIARSGWIVEQPRNILKAFIKDFVEMHPHGKDNYCCGGGGGTVSIDEIHDFRMNVAGKAKADQLRATGADVVVAPCANCKKQLREVTARHKVPIQVAGLHDLILRAMFPVNQGE